MQVSGLLFCSWAKGINYIQCSDYVIMTFGSTFVAALVFILYMNWLPNGFNLLKAIMDHNFDVNEPLKITSFASSLGLPYHTWAYEKQKSGIRNQESESGNGTGTGRMVEWFRLGGVIDVNTPPPFFAFLARWMMIHKRNE